MKSIVWWNGPSVKQFYNIPPQECEIGCNFILDHRKVHHVCCYDKPTMDIIDKKGKGCKSVKYYPMSTGTRTQADPFNGIIDHPSICKERESKG